MTTPSTVSDNFAPRLFGAALVVFGMWVCAFFGALWRWQATLSNQRVVTDVEIHSGAMRPGYDLLALAVGAAIVIVWRLRHPGGRTTLLSDVCGIALGVLLAVGMLYYGSSRLDRFLPRPFTGEGWFEKSAAAYAAVVLMVLMFGAIVARARHSQRSA